MISQVHMYTYINLHKNMYKHTYFILFLKIMSVYVPVHMSTGALRGQSHLTP